MAHCCHITMVNGRGKMFRQSYKHHHAVALEQVCVVEIAYHLARPQPARHSCGRRPADILLITGPFTRNMQSAALAAFQAMPHPRRVITVGDGFQEEGLFAGSYAVVPLPEEIAKAQVMHIPGDPPSPCEILDALLELVTLW